MEAIMYYYYRATVEYLSEWFFATANLFQPFIQRVPWSARRMRGVWPPSKRLRGIRGREPDFGRNFLYYRFFALFGGRFIFRTVFFYAGETGRIA